MTGKIIAERRLTQQEHDWHCERYVEHWITRIEQKSTRLARQRRQRYRNMLGQFQFSRSQSVRLLDLGVGWGDLTKEIFNVFPKAQVLGVDFSAAMLKRADETLSPWKNQVSLHRVDLTNMNSLTDLGQFDGIVSASTLHHLTAAELDVLFSQIVKHLKSDGCFINCDVFFRSKRIPTRMLWRFAQIARRMNVSNAVAAYLERIAFAHQSGTPQVEFGHPKPCLREYLDRLDAHGLKGRWELEGYRFIVTAALVDKSDYPPVFAPG